MSVDRELIERTIALIASHPAGLPRFVSAACPPLGVVVAEIAKGYRHRRSKPPLFFWRDRTGHEIDLLVEDAAELYPAASATLVYGGGERQERAGMKIRPWFSIEFGTGGSCAGRRRSALDSAPGLAYAPR